VRKAFRKAFALATMAAALVATPARAGEAPVLPSDFFQPNLGKLEDSVEIRQVSKTEFHLRQHVGGGPIPRDAGSVLNYAAFCVAYGIASSRGFRGSALTMKPPPSDKPPTERLLTVFLANAPGDMKPSPQTTGYMDNARLRDGICKQFVNPKYLK
jgi:hypothetical protein